MPSAATTPYSEREVSAWGSACVEAQRRTPGNADPGFERLFVVGGHVLETEVSAVGVTHRIIHRWRDSIGERIVLSLSTLELAGTA